jgi:hypothetical protein
VGQVGHCHLVVEELGFEAVFLAHRKDYGLRNWFALLLYLTL